MPPIQVLITRAPDGTDAAQIKIGGTTYTCIEADVGNTFCVASFDTTNNPQSAETWACDNTQIYTEDGTDTGTPAPLLNNQAYCITNQTQTTFRIGIEGPTGALLTNPDFLDVDPGETGHFVTNKNAAVGTIPQELVEVCPCVAAGTRVATASGAEVPVEQLRHGDAVLDHRGRPLTVRRVVEFAVPVTDFVRLGGSDASALLIRRDHPVLDTAGRERPCQEHDGAEEVTLEQPRRVYTLVTQDRAYVEMQGGHRVATTSRRGHFVATWSEAAWRLDRQRAAPHRELQPETK